MSASISAIFTAGAESGGPDACLLDDQVNGVRCTRHRGAGADAPVQHGSNFYIVRAGSFRLSRPGQQPVELREGQACALIGGAGWTWSCSPDADFLMLTFASAAGASPAEPRRPVVITPGALPEMSPSTPTPAHLLISGDPKQCDVTLASDPTGRMNVGVWETTAYHRKAIAFPKHEIMYLLDGSLALTDAAGTTHSFARGDVFLVSLGTVCDWQTDGLKKIYCTIVPEG